MKPSGPRVIFAASFKIMNSTSAIDIGLFKFSISCISVGNLCRLRICPFHPRCRICWHSCSCPYPFNVCRIYAMVMSPLPDVGNVCVWFFPFFLDQSSSKFINFINLFKESAFDFSVFYFLFLLYFILQKFTFSSFLR